MGKCEHKRTAINAGLQRYCFECGKVLGDVQVELRRLEARVGALEAMLQTAWNLSDDEFREALQESE